MDLHHYNRFFHAKLNKRPCVNVTFLNKRPLFVLWGRLLKQGRLFVKITPIGGRLFGRGAYSAEGAYSVIYGMHSNFFNTISLLKIIFQTKMEITFENDVCCLA